jgi:type I restriction enzyme, R subunit
MTSCATGTTRPSYPGTAEQIRARARRLYVDGVDVYVWGDAYYVADGDGQRLRMVEYRQYVRDRLLRLDLSVTDPRSR